MKKCFLILPLFLIPFFLTSQSLNLNFPSVNGKVFALTAKGNTLFIGGEFVAVEGIPRKNLAANQESFLHFQNIACATPNR